MTEALLISGASILGRIDQDDPGGPADLLAVDGRIAAIGPEAGELASGDAGVVGS